MHSNKARHRFFAVLNLLFLPVLYFFYPETSGRSLEEIDLIFAKGFDEKIGYVQAAKQLPHLTLAETAEMARGYGFNSSDDEGASGAKPRHSEKEGDIPDTQNSGVMA